MKKIELSETTLKLIGRALMMLCLIFIFKKILAIKGDLYETILNRNLLLTCLVYSCIYGFSQLFLSYGWLLLLRSRIGTVPSMSWWIVWPLYGKAQLAKYIPGNVFHIVGRHLSAVKHGVGHRILLNAAIMEIIQLIASATLISILAIEEIWPFFQTRFDFIIFALIGAAIILVSSLTAYRAFIFEKFKKYAWLKIFASQFFYLVYLAISCLLFLIILSITLSNATAIGKWQLVAGAYAFSWVLGFVVPGAPGGIGVRESAILLSLSGSFPEESVLVSVVLFRFVSVAGDVIFFILSVCAEHIYKKVSVV